MKTLKKILILIFLSGCGQSKNQKEKDEALVKIDTILIDSRSELIFLRDNLSNSLVSLDGNYLYNYNADKPAIEKINLMDGILEKSIHIEKEGPNGIGDNSLSLHILNDSLFVLSGSDNYLILDNKADLVKSVKLGFHFYYDERLIDSFMTMEFLYRDQKAYSIIGIRQSFSNKLMVYTEETDSFQIFDIPKSGLIKSASIISVPGNSFYYVPQLTLSQVNDKIIISNRTFPDIVVTNTDSIDFIHYYPESELYSKIEEVDEVPHVKTQEDVEEFLFDIEKRMNFLPPIWDSHSKVFYRWGFKLSSSYRDFESREYDNFLFIMDSNFKIVNEFKIPKVRLRPYKTFIRDNKIYLYQNYNDELMFIRFWLDIL